MADAPVGTAAAAAAAAAAVPASEQRKLAARDRLGKLLTREGVRPQRKSVNFFYGVEGTGKSFEAAYTFQRSLYVKTAPNVLAYYESRLVAGELPDRAMPKKVYPLYKYSAELDDKDRLIESRTDTMGTILEITKMLVAKSTSERKKKLPLTYWNFVIDESGELYERIFEQLVDSTYDESRKGATKTDTRGAYGDLGGWSADFFEWLRLLPGLGLNVCLVGHDKEADIAAKKRGGPALQSQGTMKQACRASDNVLFRALKDRKEPGLPSERFWVCHASEHQSSKLRGVKAEDLAGIGHFNAEEILAFGGYAANYESDEDCAQWTPPD